MDESLLAALDSAGTVSRRRFLARNAMGVGSVALAWLLREERLLATPPVRKPARSTPMEQETLS